MADVAERSEEVSAPTTVDINPLDLSAPLSVLDPRRTPKPTVGQAIEAARHIRRALSVESNLSEVIDAFLELDPLPILRKYLGSNSDTLTAEAGWIMANIAASDSAHCDILIEHNIHEDLCELLIHPSLDVVEQCIWGLGNIAGDCVESRDLLLSTGVAQKLRAAFMRTHSSKTFRNNLAWTLSNLCRSKPRPDDAYLAPIFDVFRCALSSVDGASVTGDDIENEWLCDVLWAVSSLSDGSNDEIQRCLDFDLLQLVLKLFRAEVDAPGIGEASETLRRRIASEQLGEVLAYLPQAYLVPLCVVNKDVFITSVCDHKEVYNRLRSNFIAATRKLRVPTLGIVGNVLSGTDAQTTLAIEHGAVKLLEVIAEISELPSSDRREVLWALSNLAGGTTEHALAVVKSEVLVNTVHQALVGTNKTLIREALWILANLTARDDGRLYAIYPHLTDKVLIPGIALCLFHHICNPAKDRDEQKSSRFVKQAYQLFEGAVNRTTMVALTERVENSGHEPQIQQEIQAVVDVLWDESSGERRDDAKIEAVIGTLIGYRHFLQRCAETRGRQQKSPTDEAIDPDSRDEQECVVSFAELVFFLYLKVAGRIVRMRGKRRREEEEEAEAENAVDIYDFPV